MWLPYRYKSALGFVFLEPCFELLFLVLHNFVFYHIAGLQFGGVSIGALLAFLYKFHLSNLYIEQYLVMLPIAACLGLFIFARQLAGAFVQLKHLLLAAAYMWLLLCAMLLLGKYRILHVFSWPMFISWGLSSLYWFSSVSLSWAVLVIARLL
ncbi:MAG: hypothetical protein QWI73_04320 [Alphaproteobacteria bacterium]|nr:hypothetical protein [Alphaproteobacteria bacterium]